MALQIWCPFTSDTRQQGLSNISISITSNQGSIVTNGKLGKCLKTSSQSIDLNYTPDLNNKSLSIGGWFKFNKAEIQAIITSTANITEISTACTGNLIGNNAYGGFGLIYGTNNLYTSNKELSSIGIYPYIRTSTEAKTASSFSITFDTWYHIFAIWDNENRKLKLYINGVLYSSNSVGAFSDAVSRNLAFNSNWTGGGNGPGLSIPFYSNDVRVYDHALSPKEIEILSRGLVCHYPLNGGGRGGDNLLKNTGDLTLWAKEAGITTTWDSEKNLYKIVDSTHTSNRWGIYQDINIEANTSYTITCTLNGDNCAVAFGFYDSSTSFPGNLITVTDSTTKRLSYTVTSGASSTKARVYLNINCANSATKTAWFGTPKVEKGSVSTPWIPNSADTAYSAMGYNSTTEYDVSGYGYNGTKNGTIAYLTDTPRYNVSTNIKGASSYIQIPNLTTTGFGDSYSFAWWGKVPSYQGYMMWGFSNGQRLNGIINGNLWNTGDGANNPLYVPGTTTQVTVPTTKVWHHWVMTGDGTTCKVYQDGVLWGQAKTYKSISGTTIYINGWDSGTSYTYGDYQMSDFRIYATALSAAQVAELYNTAVSVANNGTLMGYELIET